MESKDTELEVFETMPIGKAVRTLAIPTVISQLIVLIYNMADTFFLGQTGDTNQVAAVTLSFPVFMMISAIGNLFGIGGGSLVSRLLGEKKTEEAGRVSTFALWSGGIAALVLTVAMIFLSPVLLGLLGADEQILPLASDYILYTVIIGGVPSVLNLILSNLIRAKGAAKTASIGMSIGGGLNLILDPILILGLHMNVAGAALATCISNTLSAVYYILYIYRSRKESIFAIRLRAKLPGGSMIKQIFSIGMPAALTVLLAAVSNSIMMNLLSGFSAPAIAGLGVAQKVELIPFYIVQGISSGVLPLLAYNYASGNHRRMNQAVQNAVRTGIVIAMIAFVLIELTSPVIVHMFIADADTVSYGAVFTRIRCLALPFITIEFMLIAVFQGIGSAKQAFVLSFFRKGILDVPVMFLMNRLWPLYGLMLVQPIMECMGAAIAVVMYQKKKKIFHI